MKHRSIIPGILLLVSIGVLAKIVTSTILGLNHLIFAILIGMVVGNSIGIPNWAHPGIKTHKLCLEAGIILMGASIAVDQISTAGIRILSVIVGVVIFTSILIELLSRILFDIPEKVGSLLAAGSSVCGVSAVAAVAGAIKARQDHVAYAAATVLLFDAITIFIYPVLGRLFGLSDIAFGIWAGVTMFSTGPVAAAGFAYSDTAGQWAILTKLTRNSLIGGAVVVYALYYTQRSQSNEVQQISPKILWDTFPKFVLGFFAMVILTSSGLFSESEHIFIENASNWLFLIAFAGLGLEIRLSDLRNTGISPLLVVLVALTTVSSLTLMIINIYF